MRFKQVGNKADMVAVVIHNADTVTIPSGSPVVLKLNGTNDGLDVVLPSTAGNAQLAYGGLFGVSTQSMAVGDYSEAVVFGFTYNLLFIRQTRSATSGGGTWSTEAARSIGEFLTVDTVNNGFLTAASAVNALTVSTGTVNVAVGTIAGRAILAQTLASYASSGTATSDTRTAITAAVRAFVRLM